MFNRGIFNEYDIIKYLNRKRISQLNNNWKYILETMFGTLSPLKRVKAGHLNKFIKPDIWVEYKGVKKTISIKSGRSKSIHTESLDSLCEFMRSEGISERTIKIIRLFHYGDGTFDGTGKERYEYDEVYHRYKKYIDEANKELNNNKEFVIKFVTRVMFQGVDPNERIADYLFFGYVDLGGEVVSREKLLSYIMHKNSSNWDFKKTIHIGPISLRPHARYAHTAIRNEMSRHKMNCEWDDLLADLAYIVKRYGG